MNTDTERLRVMFLVQVPLARREAFLAAYEQIRYSVAAVPGHVQDQLCLSVDDAEQWLITSEWATAEDFLAWERGDAHRALTQPLRRCITEARSLRFVIRRETAAVATGAGRADASQS